MDSRDTRADPHRVKASPQSINGPCLALNLDLIVLLLFCVLVYIIYILQFIGPFNDWNTFWISHNYHMNQGTPP